MSVGNGRASKELNNGEGRAFPLKQELAAHCLGGPGCCHLC